MTSWAVELWGYLALSGVALLAGFTLAGLIAEFVPADKVAKRLGGSGRGMRLKSVLTASAVGVPMPLCSCSVIPTASALRHRGAGRGASAAFAVSTPEIDAPSVTLSWVLLGPAVAIIRPVAAFTSAMLVGLGINLTESSERANEHKAAKTCGSCGSGPESRPGFTGRILRALRVGFLEMPKDLGLWLVIGLGLSGLIGALVGPDWLSETFGEGAGAGMSAKLAALVVGIPLYVCATSSTPLAAAMIAAGLSPGAAIVFLLAGPATNPATLAWALKDLGVKAAVIYLLVISGVALGAGVLTDAVLLGWVASTMPIFEGGAHEHVGPVQTGAGIVLGLVLVVGITRSVRSKLARRKAASLSSSAGSCCSKA